MKCSVCSKPLRPVVAIDIDGTLADYHEHLRSFAELWLAVELDPLETYAGDRPYSEWFTEAFGIDKSTFRAIKLAYRQGGLKRSMPMWAHADGLVNGLREIAEVWVVTTRPWDRYDRVDPDSREWLRRNRIEYDGLIYDADKMDVLADRVEPERVCFVLDDLTENLERADTLFPNVGTALRLTPYNSLGPRWRLTVGTLLDARAIATAHAQDWQTSHHFDELPTRRSPHE